MAAVPNSMVASVAPGGELPGVLDQVLKHGPDENTVRGHPDILLDGEADPAAGITGPQALRDRGDLRAEIDGFKVHVGVRYLRQAQQVIDDRAHPLARRLDSPGVAAAGFAENLAVLLDQRLAEPVQPAQRSAQVMGDRVAERLQVLVRPLQFSRALLDAGLELGGERTDLGFGFTLGGDVAHGADVQQRAAGWIADQASLHLAPDDATALSHEASLRRIGVDLSG